MEFFTIGVYNSTEQEYFKKLTDNGIDTFCDIRKRRGVRGSQYAFVNSNRLQHKLSNLHIKYSHFINLAPTEEIREIQKQVDMQHGELKRERNKLSRGFTIAYKTIILDKFNLSEFIDTLNKSGGKRVVLFCVEERPEACHRSIVTEKLEQLGYKITHL